MVFFYVLYHPHIFSSLNSTAIDSNYHIGGQKEGGVWVWSHTGTPLTAGYEKWQPSVSAGDCLQINPTLNGDFNWDALNCDGDALKYICEIPVPNY